MWRGLSFAAGPSQNNFGYWPTARSINLFHDSEDGKEWHILRVFELGNGPEPRIGLEAQSPAGQGAEVTFTNVRYEARKIADVYNEP